MHACVGWICTSSLTITPPTSTPSPATCSFCKIGRPIEGGLNTLAARESTDVRDPFLGLRLGFGSRLDRKLEHHCFLIFKHVGQQHELPVWKF